MRSVPCAHGQRGSGAVGQGQARGEMQRCVRGAAGPREARLLEGRGEGSRHRSWAAARRTSVLEEGSARRHGSLQGVSAQLPCGACERGGSSRGRRRGGSAAAGSPGSSTGGEARQQLLRRSITQPARAHLGVWWRLQRAQVLQRLERVHKRLALQQHHQPAQGGGGGRASACSLRLGRRRAARRAGRSRRGGPGAQAQGQGLAAHRSLFILTASTEDWKLKSWIVLLAAVFITVSLRGVSAGCSPAGGQAGALRSASAARPAPAPALCCSRVPAAHLRRRTRPGSCRRASRRCCARVGGEGVSSCGRLAGSVGMARAPPPT
jgi:hypothetical protein